VNGSQDEAGARACDQVKIPCARGCCISQPRGIYASFDAGDTWQPLQTQPAGTRRCYGIARTGALHDLVIATYGRASGILDDITPLQQLTP